MVGATGIPRTAQGCRLWGTRNDLIALYLSNLLVVEPWHTVNVCDVDFVIPTVNKKQTAHGGCFLFMVGATGIEPATPCTPCKYSTRLSYAPTYAYLYPTYAYLYNYHELKASIYFMLARIGKKLLVFAYQ